MVLKKELVAKWVDENPVVQQWLRQLASSTRVNCARRVYDYFMWLRENGGKFAGLSVSELLDRQDRAVGRARYEQLDVLQRYVNGLSLRASTKRLAYSVIRGFYARSRVELPRDPRFVIRSDIPPPTREIFTVEGVRRLIGVMPRGYHAVFLCMFQGAMGAEELMVFNQSWRQVRPQLMTGRARVKIALPGRKHSKNKRPYYTFIGRDAVVALKAYVEADRGAIVNGGPIFLNSIRNPLTKANIKRAIIQYGEKVGLLKRPTPPCPSCGGDTIRKRRRHWVHGVKQQKTSFLCRKCGRETMYDPEKHAISLHTRYGINSHELRDIFRTEWHLSGADPTCAEFFMGHDIDPNHYDKIMKLHPEWAEEQYAKAEPFLNIVSEDPRKVGLDRVRELEEKAKEIEALKREMADQKQDLKNVRTALRDIESLMRTNITNKNMNR